MKKDQHIEYALKCKKEANSLASIRLKYCSIPSIDIEDVDISTSFAGHSFKNPVYINAMTGGSKKADLINKRLLNISKKADVFLFSGSYSPNLKEEKYYYPLNVGANIGADKSLADIKKTVEKTACKILQIHLNPIQEFMMFDGKTKYSTWEKNIKDALNNITVPVIIKETGYGMSSYTIEKLINMGVKTIDISSKGGTNFSFIEDKRANKDRSYLYELGYTLKESLFNSRKYQDKVEILASGGVFDSLTVVKCLALGAKAVGLSLYILKLLETNTDDEIVEKLNEMIYEIKAIMAVTDSKNIEILKDKWEEI